ncbi:MAG: hypothetical protein Q8L66_00140 [Caulobacter sp.]|nr:hypothetical protein [Caulobacter sp.]
MATPAAARAEAAAVADLPFKIDLPAGFEVTPRPRGPDFIVFDVVKGADSYVGVYVGGFASFPMHKDLKVEGRGGGLKVALRDGRPVEYLWFRETGWPTQLHVWIQVGADADPAIADRIAASIGFAP